MSDNCVNCGHEMIQKRYYKVCSNVTCQMTAALTDEWWEGHLGMNEFRYTHEWRNAVGWQRAYCPAGCLIILNWERA